MLLFVLLMQRGWAECSSQIDRPPHSVDWPNEALKCKWNLSSDIPSRGPKPSESFRGLRDPNKHITFKCHLPNQVIRI